MSIHLNFYVPEEKKQVFFSSCEVFCVLTALMVFQQENTPKSLKRLLKAHTHMYIVKEKGFFNHYQNLQHLQRKLHFPLTVTTFNHTLKAKLRLLHIKSSMSEIRGALMQQYSKAFQFMVIKKQTALSFNCGQTKFVDQNNQSLTQRSLNTKVFPHT